MARLLLLVLFAELRGETMSDNTASGSENKGSKIVLIATIINTVGMIGIAVLTFIGFQKDKERQSVADISLDSTAAGQHESGHGDKEDSHGGGHGEPQAQPRAAHRV